MNHLLKFIILLSVSITSFSCSDEFVDEKLNVSGDAASVIIISPTWDATEYQFICDGIEDATFSVISKPDWLVLENNSGKFIGSIATIHASAQAKPQFSEMGIYIDQMLITSEGKQYAIPLYYITEGDPTIQISRNLFMRDNYDWIEITNWGAGILFWDIVSMPNWLTVNMNQFNINSVMLAPWAKASVPIMLNKEGSAVDDYHGTIILKTNDKNSPLVEINVDVYHGSPGLVTSTGYFQFESYETSKTLIISNFGNLELSWSFEELPQWLSVSPASGKNMPETSTTVTFTCDSSKAQGGTNNAILKLKSNDPNKPSVDIIVEYIPPIK